MDRMLQAISPARIACIALLALLALLMAGGAAFAARERAGAAAAQDLPDSPAAYAQAVFDGWVDGDGDAMVQLATPSVAQLLLARDPGSDSWDSTASCDAGAGSTSCTWASDDVSLALRVANEPSSNGEPHAVVDAAFVTNTDAIAFWPLTTQEEADNTQQSVDEGHSPWMVDPSAVGASFAQAVLGWTDAYVEAGPDPSQVDVFSRETGVVARLTLAQPVKTGADGIWVVTRLAPAVDHRVVVDAPVESVSIVATRSQPPQYIAQIVAGLPSGCAEPDGYDVARDGDRITIHVTNTMPSGEPICTAIYGTYSLSVNLGSDFVPGSTYTVDVNGTAETFVAV